jgi:hypothetical protein
LHARFRELVPFAVPESEADATPAAAAASAPSVDLGARIRARWG